MLRKRLVELIPAVLAAAVVGAAEYEPEPKPERITVGVLSGHPFHAGDGDVVKYWREKVEKILPDRPDLIVLPETADEQPDGRSSDPRVREYFQAVAREHRTFVAFPTLRTLRNGKFANSIELFDRNGKTVGVYDKNCVTTSELAAGRIAGKRIDPWNTEIGTIAPLICWDLNFHREFPQYFKARPNLIVFASRYHGGLIQRYWAYECRSWFLGAFAFGECTVINPLGEVVARTTNYRDAVTARINLDCQVVPVGDGNAPRFARLKAKYGRGVTISEPGHLGVALVTSELKHVSCRRMLEEFGIRSWDRYYEASLEEIKRNGGLQ